MPGPPKEIAERAVVSRQFAEDANERGEHFYFLRIPEDIGPHERGDKYEDPLSERLEIRGIGKVTGGGQQLGPGDSILYAGIDVVVWDSQAGLKLLIETLRALGAPEDTVIEEHYPSYREFQI